MLSAVEVPCRSSGSPSGRSTPELRTSAEERNLTVPHEEGGSAGSLLKFGCRKGLRLCACSHEGSKGKQASPAYWLCGWVVFNHFCLLILGPIFLLHPMPGNCCLDARHYKFCLLDAGDLCFPVNTVDLCSGIQLSYLEMV